MNERPILFSGDMVRAILDGRKTQTRRLIKPQPPYYTKSENVIVLTGSGIKTSAAIYEFSEELPLNQPYADWAVLCPYGKPGDRLWVRETWYCADTKSKPSEIREDLFVLYKADTESYNEVSDYRWRPSVHMPRWASRLTLEVTRVWVERVQSISEADALAEGIVSNSVYADNPDERLCHCPDCDGRGVFSALGSNYGVIEVDCDTCNTPGKRFRILWDSIYTKRGLGWDVNPWVWVVEFEVRA